MGYHPDCRKYVLIILSSSSSDSSGLSKSPVQLDPLEFFPAFEVHQQVTNVFSPLAVFVDSSFLSLDLSGPSMAVYGFFSRSSFSS